MKGNNYSININNMIALCHIVDEFKEFEKRFLEIKSKKHNSGFVLQLLDVSKGKFKIGLTKIKEFYNENKTVIDTINKYSNIQMFLNQNYGYHGEIYGDLNFFYEYLLKHKEEISKILMLLNKIKELGFDKLQFNENLDFSKEIYDVDPLFSDNLNVIYVANPQVIPNYTDKIKYRTLDSNYKITVRTGINEYIKGVSKIELNSLLFNSDILPLKLDKKHTFDYIINLKNQQKETTKKLRNSVNLDDSVLNLCYQVSLTENFISRLDGIEKKEELIQVLASIKNDIIKLKGLSDQYEKEIIEKDPILDKETIDEEKKKYLNNRKKKSVHWD